MSGADELRSALSALRREAEAHETTEQVVRALLRDVDRRRRLLSRRGDREQQGRARLEVEEAAARRRLVEASGLRAQARERIAEAERRLRDLAPPLRAVELLDAALPIVLLPVRLEARFRRTAGGPELWVRIFPDDIAVESHDPLLTTAELAAGTAYWEAAWRGGPDAEVERVQWQALAARFGVPRAAYIARTLEPAGERPPQPIPADEPLGVEIPAPPTRAEGLARAPRVRVLPDHFVVLAYVGDQLRHEVPLSPIPSPLVAGPDPSDPATTIRRRDGKLEVGADLAWLTDFDAAVTAGMAVRIPISEDEAGGGFDRLLALGVRTSSDAGDAVRRLEELLDAHHYTDGLSLVPQGTPTNNTLARKAGPAAESLDADSAFGIERKAPLFSVQPDPHARSDAERLSRALGLSPGVLQHVPHGDAADAAEAEAMQRVLWPATLGYTMTEMMEPVFEEATVRETRRFFTRHVKGRGSLPTLRVGRQPYGFLPTTVFSRWNEEAFGSPFSVRLHRVVRDMHPTWQALGNAAPRVGGAGDPDKNFIRALGLQPSSVEFYARTLVGLDYYTNLAAFKGQLGAAELWSPLVRNAALAALGGLGVKFPDRPRVLSLSFFRDVVPLDGPFVDDRELSETDALRAIDPGFGNYIHWLRSSDVASIRDQRFGVDAQGAPRPAPTALLYLLLRQALLQAYFHATSRILSRLAVVEPALLREREILNVGGPSLTRWDLMELQVPAVAPGRSIASVLASPIALTLPESDELEEAKDALAGLAGLPTARLERLFAEHLDCCSHRLDAWELAFVSNRLEAIGGARHERGGFHLGAYGWLEELRPRPAPVRVERVPTTADGTPVVDAGDGPLVTDPSSGGLIHAPSLNHAVAAAVLRSGYMTHARRDNAGAMAVNLTSERVRRALGYVTGLRNGQPLSALLGYRFERGLHDRNPALVLDQFILEIRTRFPLASGRVTATPPGVTIDAIEARNVVDGKALLQAARTTAWPYGVTGLPGETSAAGVAIKAEIDRLADDADAIADLALAEATFQAVQGKYERAGAVLKMASEGGPIPEFEVVQTPRSGIGVLHRLIVGFDELSPAASPWAGAPPTPRARLEPRLNHWLGTRLGDPADVRCQVVVSGPPADLPVVVTLKDLAVAPIDFVFFAGRDLGGGMSELERRIAWAARSAVGADDARRVEIRFMERRPGWGPQVKTFFELWPLVLALRDVVTGRAADATDFRLPGDVTPPGTEPRGYDSAELVGRAATLRADLGGAVDDVRLARAAVEAAGALPPPALLDDLRGSLWAAVLFQFPDAIPENRTAATTAAAEALVTRAHLVEGELQARLDRVDAALAAPFASAEEQVRRMVAAVKAALTDAFAPLPLFTAANSAEIRGSLLDRASLLSGAPPLPIESWLAGVSPVRARVDRYARARTLADAFGVSPAEPLLAQLPFTPGARWVALPLQGAAPASGETLAVVIDARVGWDPLARQSGIVVDEWHEVIPSSDTTTGLAFHFDRPSSEPPQAILVALAPEPRERWRSEDLVDTLRETLDMARIRCVETEDLGTSEYAELLPALLEPMTRNLSSITVDLRFKRALTEADRHAISVAEEDL